MYVVNVTASGSDGSTITASQVFTVAPAAVAPSITGAPKHGVEGVPIQLGSSLGTLAVSGQPSYTWTVSGAASSSVSNTTGTFEFTPASAGSYTVSLSVKDGAGNITSGGTATIAVAAAKPTLQITNVPTSAAAGNSVTLDGTASIPGIDGASADFTLGWQIANLSGGAIVASGSGSSVTYLSAAAGDYVATLTATASSGVHTSTMAYFSVTPQTAAITLTASNPLKEGTMGFFQAALNNPLSGTYTFAWTVTGLATVYSASGAGTPLTVQLPTSQFRLDAADSTLLPVAGPYLVTVTATNGSQVTTASQVFSAGDLAPTATIVTSSTLQSGTPITVSAANVSATGVLRYSWNVTGPNASRQPSLRPAVVHIHAAARRAVTSGDADADRCLVAEAMTTVNPAT